MSLRFWIWDFCAIFQGLNITKIEIVGFLKVLNYMWIQFDDSKSPKSAILPHLKVLTFDFYVFLHFMKAEIYQINKITAPKMAQIVVLDVLDSQQ